MKSPVSVFVILSCLPLSAHAAQIEIGPGVCDTLTNYIEPPGVEYQSGIDGNGDPVVPPELGGQPSIKFPDHFVIGITDDLSSRLTAGATGTTPAIQTPVGVVNPQALLGTITVDHGRLAFNGQPIGETVDGDLALLCQKARRSGP
jgi:hypothetical protein